MNLEIRNSRGEGFVLIMLTPVNADPQQGAAITAFKAWDLCDKTKDYKVPNAGARRRYAVET